MLPFLYSNFANMSVLNNSIRKPCLLTKMLEVNSNITKLEHSSIDGKNIELINPKNYHYFSDFLIENKTLKDLLQQYWTEYIYISTYNPDSHSFEDVASRDYLLQDSYVRNYSRNQLNLKEYLVNNKVIVSYSKTFNFLNNGLSIKYFHEKYINRLYTSLLNSYMNTRKALFSKPLSNNLIEKLKKQKLPIFLVVNGAGEMIIGEPEHRLHMRTKLLESLLKLNKKAYINQEDYRLPLREGYVFLNPFDAIEYYNYLKVKYLYSSNELQLKIFIGTIKDYYEKSNSLIKDTQFRLLPDLSEVGKLVTKYQYDSNVHFNSKQIYGKNHFQGQPIYFINPVLSVHVNKLSNKVNKHYFPNLLALNTKDYFKVFTNYKDLMSMWVQYRTKFQDYSLPRLPQVTVYNLESFLEEHKNQNTSFQFVPSYDAYKYVKNLDYTQNSRFLKMINTKLIVVIKVWINRFLWGMLKWYPPIQ